MVDYSLKRDVSTPFLRFTKASCVLSPQKAVRRSIMQSPRESEWEEFKGELLRLLDDIRSPLASIAINEGAQYISLTPNGGGFPIAVSKEIDGTFLLSFGCWFDEFESITAVLNLISEALAGGIRIRTEKINGKTRSVLAEIQVDGSHWVGFGEISYLRFNFLRRTPVVTHQQFGIS